MHSVVWPTGPQTSPPPGTHFPASHTAPPVHSPQGVPQPASPQVLPLQAGSHAGGVGNGTPEQASKIPLQGGSARQAKHSATELVQTGKQLAVAQSITGGKHTAHAALRPSASPRHSSMQLTGPVRQVPAPQV